MTLLTPNLTRLQAATLRDHLLRLTGLPELAASSLYADADRLAGRWMMSPMAAHHQAAPVTTAELLHEHRQPLGLVAYVAGLAHGVRLGRTFIRPAHRSKQWISEEYRQLQEHNRREVARYVRRLLKAQGAPRFASGITGATDDVTAARAWVRRAHEQGRSVNRHASTHN